MGLRDYGLYALIARNAQVHADRPAIVFEGRTITHRAYRERVDRLAAALAARGLAAGERVAVIAQNRLEFLDLYGAAARLGLVLVPVNWRASVDEMVHAITDTTPALAFVDAQYHDAANAARAKCASLKAIVSYGGAAQGIEAYDALLAQGDGAAADAAALVARDAALDASAGYVVFHTAAVAGMPRGALLSQAGLLAASAQSVHHWQLGPDDVNLGALPLFHVAGLGLFLAVAMAGGCTVLAPRFDAARALDDIARHRVTVFSEFAPMLGSILDAAGERAGELASLRVVTGLDTPPTIERFERTCPNARFWAGYGQSEVSGMVTVGPWRERPGSAGRPALLSQVAVHDELDRPQPPGTVGEIVVRGPTVFLGYWNRDDDNALTFREGWHHTGDMGRFDEQGWLWYAGRSPAKELIKPGGENVYPAEVEHVLRAHEAIAEAVVIGVPDAQWGEAIKAVCVCRPGATPPAPEALAEFVGARIARFKRPKHVVYVDALPRTQAGAIDRMKVREQHGGA